MIDYKTGDNATKNKDEREVSIRRLKREPIALESDVQEHLGKCLRDAYGQLVSEPVPDHFIKLLDELARKDGEGS
ncbi:MAG: NepR family anti-sigma factor [Hyphomicrobiales bacterium]|nr:NepR family anti-sigma factor [Hyphomicrobiales bacterium]